MLCPQLQGRACHFIELFTTCLTPVELLETIVMMFKIRQEMHFNINDAVSINCYVPN